MFNIVRGFISGLVATVVISIAMVIANLLGLMPDLSIVPQIENEARNPIEVPILPALGWAIHFLIGTLIWSFVFALLAGRASVYTPRTHALWFGLILWLILMLVLMPIAGHGLFGVQAGLMVPVVTLAFHLLWGWAISFIYDLLPAES